MLRWYDARSKIIYIFRAQTNTYIRYQARLVARPLLTQAITTSILFAVGDITAQQIVEKRTVEKHDIARTGRMALYGGGTSIHTITPLSHI